MAAREEALNGQPAQVGAKKTRPGSIDALVASYYQTADFAGLRPSTKTTYRGIIERFRAEHGDKRVAKMETRHVRQIIGAKASTPTAANNLLRMIHLLMRHAVELGWRRDDPTQGVRKIKVQSSGFATWAEEHIDAFLATHKPGTRAHLAFMLLLYTGQRRSDVVRMGRQHVRDGVLTITQQKTGTTVHVPVLKPLREAIDAIPRDHLTFLTTA
jgi:integrase